eukprot:CAMPEP_0201522130 /NCGR_PEP_ID=MMETSP0161_2-20130828/16471_1 /ASSEMBLY_ACC=CAM_ASM_000251 /TAXON_ID=180227 /ORGANISM="Neoparamoeba aestuarina, Strain SoJaBio B1-5/56/2" /LENGTH=337 /DNA_ID=CAMNT_0047920895 /DNA_START=42 /DNA_END=1055 /DNA_ORIENTATION=-
MQRSLLRFVQQISIASGKAYEGPFVEELEKRNFSSNYWINSEVLKKTEIKVKPDQVDLGISLNKGILYNAAQTTDPKKLESLSGKLLPKSALTGKPLKIGGNLPRKLTGDNSWIAEYQVKALELTPKSDAATVDMTIDNKSVKMYPIESFDNAAALKKAFSIKHISIASGVPYKGKNLLELIKAAIQNGYTSGIWLTKAKAEKIGATFKPNQEPVVLAGEIKTELYNADQLVDKSAAEQAIDQIMSYQVVGTSGKNFPKRISDQLKEICKKNPSFTRYWLSKSQAQSEGGMLHGEKPFPIEDDRGISYFFNAAQMKSSVLDKCVRAHKNFRREMSDG